MTTSHAQGQIFLMAYQCLPDETKKEVYQILKEQFGEEIELDNLPEQKESREEEK